MLLKVDGLDRWEEGVDWDTLEPDVGIALIVVIIIVVIIIVMLYIFYYFYYIIFVIFVVIILDKVLVK